MALAKRRTASEAAPRVARNEALIAAAPEAGGGASVVAAMLVPETRASMIAQAAYYRAERRGFDPGHELDDWLDAEAEIDRLITADQQVAS